MIDLDAQPRKMTYLLDQIEQRDLALPDFQRSFVWRPDAVRELLVSVFSGYPAGAILLLRGGSTATAFTPRAVDSAPDLGGHTPALLALDGQQRLTSLYQATRGEGTHRYFVNLAELCADLAASRDYDLDEAVEVYAERRAKKWTSLQTQADDLMLPLAQITRWGYWKDEIVQARNGTGPNGEPLGPLLNKLHDDVIARFSEYQFAVTTLKDDTSLDAVCSIFDTLNRTGVKLSVFELLTARAFAEGENLRERRDAVMADYPILRDFQVDPYALLLVVALRIGKAAKRSDVLSLEPKDIVTNWDAAAGNLADAYRLIRDDCGMFNAGWVPYTAPLIVIASVWDQVVAALGPARGAARAKLKRWFWVVCFSSRYDNSVNTRMAEDSKSLLGWLQGGPEPDYVGTFVPPDDWTRITPRQRSTYRAAMGLLLSDGPLDFYTGSKLTTQLITKDAIDDHHVFPQKYLESRKPPRHEQVDCILNRTLIDRKTNQSILAKAPSTYLAGMVTARSHQDVSAVLDSHRLPSRADGPLFQDRFADFLDERAEQLNRLVRSAVGGQHQLDENRSG